MGTTQGRRFAISKDVVALLYSEHRMGIKKKADMGQIETEADKDMIDANKTLLKSREYDEIRKYLVSVKDWVKMRSVPSFFRDGCYLVRVSVVEEIEKYLRTQEVMLRGYVDAFAEVYEEKVEEARDKLKGQFNPGDYPPVAVVKKMFGWDYSWVRFDIPDDLPKEIREREIAKATNMWEEAAESITEALRESFRGLITHAVEKLQPTEDGRPKIFRDTLVTNIKDFLETFQSRNVVNDDELANLVAKARAVIEGVDKAQVLRDNVQMREEVRQGFASIEAELTAMPEVRRRKFDL